MSYGPQAANCPLFSDILQYALTPCAYFIGSVVSGKGKAFINYRTTINSGSFLSVEVKIRTLKTRPKVFKVKI
jgi:hypothetical protein